MPRKLEIGDLVEFNRTDGNKMQGKIYKIEQDYVHVNWNDSEKNILLKKIHHSRVRLKSSLVSLKSGLKGLSIVGSIFIICFLEHCASTYIENERVNSIKKNLIWFKIIFFST